MKQCPKCGTTYSDNTLIYCLADGDVLVGADEQATFVRTSNMGAANVTERFPAPAGALRVEIPQDATNVNYAAAPPPQAEPGSSWLKIALILGLVGIMGLIAIAGAGALIYFNKESRPAVTNTATNRDSNKNSNSSSPTPLASPANASTPSNSETDQLRDQIANLEKKLTEQKNSNRPPSNTPPPPDQPTVTSSSARVNSPGDGFLALRSYPSSDIGERVTRIPHGASVTIGGCLARARVGNKTGRWCRASYGGYSGWVFDAWLNY